MRAHFLAALLLAVAMPAAAQSLQERAKADELVFMADEEPAMRRGGR